MLNLQCSDHGPTELDIWLSGGVHFLTTKITKSFSAAYFHNISQGPLNGGVSNGGGFPIWTCPSFFVLFGTFPIFSGIFPICSGMVRGFSRFVLFLFIGLLRASTRNSPGRVRDAIWTFPEKSGKPPGLETHRFSFSQFCLKSELPNVVALNPVGRKNTQRSPNERKRVQTQMHKRTQECTKERKRVKVAHNQVQSQGPKIEQILKIFPLRLQFSSVIVNFKRSPHQGHLQEC